MFQPRFPLSMPLRPLCGAVIALALSAPAALAADKTLKVVMHSAMRIIDPIMSTAHITRDHGYMIYDTLVAVDAEGIPQPQMAAWTVSEDGLTWVFTLRDGLQFHDGNPVTATDVVASLKRWGGRDGAGKFLMAATADIVASAPDTITWTLSEPFPLLVATLSKQSSVPAFIMPERVAVTPGDVSITETIGSGPFVFVTDEFQPGVQVVYEKFDGYVPRSEPASGYAGGKVVNVDRVEWVNMPDSQTAINALMTGEIDLIESVQIDLLPILETSPDVVVEIRDKLGYQALARPNFKHPPFDNQKIRQAAMAAINQSDVMATMVGNADYYWNCGAIFGCGALLGSETGADVLKAGGDSALARKLLEEAGYDGTPVVIMQATDLAQATAPVVVANALRDAGFTVDLQAMDWQTLVSRRANTAAPAEGGWNMFTTFASAVEASSPLVHPVLPSGGAAGWFGWPDDPVMEDLRGAYLQAVTIEDQKAAADKVQAHAMDYVTYIPLGNFSWVQARSTALTGMLETPVPVFWSLDIAK